MLLTCLPMLLTCLPLSFECQSSQPGQSCKATTLCAQLLFEVIADAELCAVQAVWTAEFWGGGWRQGALVGRSGTSLQPIVAAACRAVLHALHMRERMHHD